MQPTPDAATSPPAAHPAWASTTDLPAIADWLRTKSNILLVTHNKPDGDAVGSALAVSRALRIALPAARVEVLFAGPVDHWAHTLASDGEFHVAAADQPGTRATVNDTLAGFDPDAILIQDTGSRSQLDGVWPWIESRAADAAIIDHHRSGDPTIAERRVINTEWAAVCQASAELASLLLNAQSPTDLPREVARLAFLGLATDTGWFRHSNVTPETMRLAADLIAVGIDHPSLLALIELQDRPSRLRLKARALTNLELFDNDTLAIMTLREQDFRDAHADTTESGGFTDDALRVESVRAAALITEVPGSEPPRCKLSLRSKPGPDIIDVNQVAGVLGGGGHANAAGARVEGSLQDARDALLAAIRKQTS